MAPALQLANVVLRRDGNTILDSISLKIERNERWIVIGPNGSGKTSLLKVMALYDHPTSGTVDVLGQRLGRTDVRELRRSVGYASAALASQLRGDLTAHDVVKIARHAALEPWWHHYTEADATQANQCLDRMGVADHRDRRFGTLSSGEQQRVLIARTMMNDPGVILLDEPSARLDLGGREHMVATLTGFAADSTAPPFVLVTHHVDEIPPGITHAAIIEGGQIVSSGPIDEVITAASLSACFRIDLRLERRFDGRFSAWSA